MQNGVITGLAGKRRREAAETERAAFAYGAPIRLPAPLPWLPSCPWHSEAQRPLWIREGALWEGEEVLEDSEGRCQGRRLHFARY
ncbi:MAG: hypothetical protein PHO89_05765 [Methylacidiphilaceae bacterium]|nr:hypothetical protein [Candidatus Methylacidiphilaceae bacterium]